MKILWLTPYPISLLREELGITKSIAGHPASWIVNLSNELSKTDNIEFHILTISAAIKTDKEFKKNNIRFHVLRHSIPFTEKGFPYYLPLDVILNYAGIKQKIVKYIHKISPNLIHIHGTEGVYAAVVKFINAPVIISIQGIINKYYEFEPSIKKYFQRKIEIEGIKNCQHLGCRTDWDEDFVKSINPLANIHYMPEAINYVFFKHHWQHKSGNKNFLFVGSLQKRKGIFTLLKAVELLKKRGRDIKLNIVGDYLQNADKLFIEFFNKLNIKNEVTFVGRKNSAEIASLLAESSIFIHPSLIDNSPNSVAEAMAVGTPCIASRTGGVPSMIDDGKTGLLFETENATELAAKIELLMDNKDFQSVLSNNSRKVALERNYPLNVAKITLAIYNKIIESNK